MLTVDESQSDPSGDGFTIAYTMENPAFGVNGLAGGNIYYYASTANTAVNGIDIEAGTGALCSGNFEQAAAGSEVVSCDGLSGGVTYYVSIVYNIALHLDDTVRST